MRSYQDLTGQQFHHLTAVRYTGRVMQPGNRTRSNAVWEFQCECGKTIETQARPVKRGYVKSCGCHVRRGALSVAWNVYKKSYADGDLTFPQFQELNQLPCTYCGAPPGNKAKYHGNVWVYSGLDRIDHDQPHHRSNVQPACWTCNQARGRTPYQEWMQYLQRITEYHGRLA